MTRGDKTSQAAGDEFVIALRDLEEDPLYIEREIGLPKIRERLKFCEYDATPISAGVKLKMESCGGGVILKGSAKAQIKSQCGTCLADAIIDVNADLSAYLTQRPVGEEALDDAELTPEDLEREWFEGDTVSLDPIIFDAIMLEIPMNPKCGTTCPGISTGRTLDNKKALDPRLAPLANLKLEKER